MVRLDLTDFQNQCEFSKFALKTIPGMIYISTDGRVIEKTETVVEKEALRLKLENLLKQ